MVFEWNAAKNAANIAKHGIDFEDAIEMFDGPVLERPDDRRDYGETPHRGIRCCRRSRTRDRLHGPRYAPQDHFSKEGSSK